MQNKIVILGVLVIFFIAMVIFHFHREFFIEEIVEGNTPSPVDQGNTMTFDENNSIGAAHATQIRKLLKQVKPYGTLSNSDVIAKVVAIGDTQPALTSILESNISNKDKVGALNTLFGLISNGLERNLLIHYNNFIPVGNGSGPYVGNNSKNPFMENQSYYDAKIVVNDQYENIYDTNVIAVNPNSLYLNGQRNKSGAYLKIPILPSFETDEGTFSGFSVSAWFYPNTVSNNFWNRLFDFGNGKEQHLLMTYSADGILGRIHTASTVADTYSLRKTMPNIMGQWNHYAWTIDSAGKWNIYLNNRILTSGITGIPEMVERKSNFIGYSNWAKYGDDLYNGWIDDFRVYDRPLSADEVTQLYRLASKRVRNIIEGAELPIDIKIPPVPSYVITNGTTNVQSPINWKQEGETTATAEIANASQDVLNGTYQVTVSSSLNFADAQEWASSCFNGIYTNPQANNFGGNFYSWVSKKYAYYKTTSPYGYINSTSETFSTTVSRKSYNGEWVQLQLPTKITIKSFYLHYAEANIGGIMGAVLAGSLDGDSWKLLYTLTNETVPKPKSIGYYSFNTNKVSYSHYRFIITHASVTDSLVGINELILST